MAGNLKAIRAGRAFVELFVDNNQLVKGLRLAEKHLKDFGNRLHSVGRRVAMVGAAMMAPFAAGVKEYAQFQQRMANVSTMLTEPQQHMAKYSKAVRAMSVEIGESTETLSMGLYQILSASVAPSKALYVLGAAAKSARAGLSDTEAAANVLTTILNAYKMDAMEAMRVSDVLFMTIKRGKTTFRELAPSIGMTISAAAVAGVPLEELGAVLALLTRNGIMTRRAVIAVNAAMMTFMKPTKDSADFARQLGFELNTTTLKAEGLIGVLKRIAGLKPEQVAKLFPNIRALRGIIPALRNLDEYASDLELMKNSAGATEIAFRKMSDTMMFQLDRSRMLLKDIAVSVGKSLAPMVEGLIDKFQEWGKYLRGVVEKNKGLVVSLAKLSAIAFGVGMSLFVLGTALIWTAMVMGAAATIISGFFAILTGIGGVLVGMATVANAWAILFLAGVYMVAEQMGLVGKVVDWLGDKWEILKEDAQKAVKGISDALAAGEIALAAKILWKTLQLEWRRGMNEIQQEGLYWFAEQVQDVLFGVESAWATTAHEICNIWRGMTYTLNAIWTKWADRWKASQIHLSSWFAKRMIDVQGVLDDKADTEFLKGRIDQQEGEAYKALLGERDKALKDNDEIYRDKLKKSTEAHQKKMEEIGAASAAERNALAMLRKADEMAAEASLDKAKKDWANAIEEARKAKERQQNAVEGDEDGMPPVPKTPPDPADILGGLASQSGAQGTFNAAALLGMQSMSIMNRIAAGIEQIVKNTEPLLDMEEMAFE